MIIIENRRTTKTSLDREVLRTQNKLVSEGKTPSPTTGNSVSSTAISPVKQIVSQTNENLGQDLKEKLGYIHRVYPKTDKVYVVCRRPAPDEYGEPLIFNHLDYFAEYIEAACTIPLIDFNPEEGQDLDKLIDKPVTVFITNKDIAIKAKLRPVDIEKDSVLDYKITPMALHTAYKHPEGVETALFKMGYSKTQIEELKTLGVIGSEIENKNKGVVRIEGEGYWDQATETDTERTIRIKNPIDAWAERNLAQMKTKLCHNPVIAFGAR